MTIFFSCIAILVLLVGVIHMIPPDYRIARSVVIQKSPEDIFPHLNDFRKWHDWSPWAKIDPEATITFEGTESGQGTIMRWNGNKNIGEGGMEILESQPSAHITIQLTFLRPMKGGGIAEFHLKPEGNSTHMTWSMSGKNNFIGKIFSLLFCRKMTETMYDKGLNTLKTLVEGGP